MSENSIKILDFLKRTQALCYIERCSNTPHIRSYSVAQHSYYIALYAMLFADLENERIREESTLDRVNFPAYIDLYDTSELMKKALLHDLEETITGDILYPVHHSDAGFKKTLDQVRKKCVDEVVFKELPKKVREYYIRLWTTSKDTTKEGILVACMDKFEILVFAVQELDMGNSAFRIIYANAFMIIKNEFSIPSVDKVLEEIRLNYG